MLSCLPADVVATICEHPDYQEPSDTHDFVFRACIVNNIGELLIVQRSFNDFLPGMWEFPGGSSDAQELDVALGRELKEEVGLLLERIIAPVYLRKVMTPQGSFTEFTFIVVASGIVRLSHEHNDFQWSESNNLPPYMSQSLRAVAAAVHRDQRMLAHRSDAI